jgi:2,5-diketo-D-gluconate reductase A
VLAVKLISSMNVVSRGSLHFSAPTKALLDRRSLISSTAAAAALLGSTTTSRAAEEADGGKTSANAIPVWKLDNGVDFPVLALNTAGLSLEGSETATRLAFEAGITNIDFHPGIERDGVARVLASSPTLAARAFLTTKIAFPRPGISPADAAANCRRQIDADLAALGVEKVDMLMLRDSPDCAVMQAQWKVLESAVKAGKARSIGVVNYCESALGCVLDVATIPPALNYFMLHAGMGPDAHGLRSFGEARGVKTFAYGTLGEPGPSEALLGSPLLEAIGERHRRGPEGLRCGGCCRPGPPRRCGPRSTSAPSAAPVPLRAARGAGGAGPASARGGPASTGPSPRRRWTS